MQYFPGVGHLDLEEMPKKNTKMKQVWRREHTSKALKCYGLKKMSCQ